MDSSSGGSSHYNELESSESSLIPGLPDDIALFCLARVPRNYHMTLTCVSKRWRSMVCSEEWRVHREKHSLSETWIYALCRDKNSDEIHCCVLNLSSSKKRCWKPIAGVPSCCLKRKGMGFQTLGKKLYLLGGCGWSQDDSDEVYCYDASMNTWSQVASMSTARSYFGCEALGGKIYAIGGNGLETSDLHSWDTYNPSSNSWESRSVQSIVFDIEDSFVMDGKIYVRSCVAAIPPYIHMVVYNPSTGNWLQTDTDIAFGWRGPAVVVDDNLYVLDQSSGTKLMMWHKDTREWIFKCRLSPLLTRPPCQMVGIGRNIYIIGKGLSTVVLDVDDISNANGVIPSSSIPIFCSDYDVISCKCLSI